MKSLSDLLALRILFDLKDFGLADKIRYLTIGGGRTCSCSSSNVRGIAYDSTTALGNTLLLKSVDELTKDWRVTSILFFKSLFTL